MWCCVLEPNYKPQMEFVVKFSTMRLGFRPTPRVHALKRYRYRRHISRCDKQLKSTHCDPIFSKSPDLPLPHGPPPWNHGLNPFSPQKIQKQRFSGFGAPIFGFGLTNPRSNGRPLFADFRLLWFFRGVGLLEGPPPHKSRTPCLCKAPVSVISDFELKITNFNLVIFRSIYHTLMFFAWWNGCYNNGRCCYKLFY